MISVKVYLNYIEIISGVDNICLIYDLWSKD